jgi:hypothetical protein
MDILRDGLKPYSPATVSGPDLMWPYICFGPTPSAAWGYSAGLPYMEEIETWDLWQVRLEEGDEVHIRAEFGPAIKVVRVRNAIPADRLWWVARRSDLAAVCCHGAETADDCPSCFAV